MWNEEVVGFGKVELGAAYPLLMPMLADLDLRPLNLFNNDTRESLHCLGNGEVSACSSEIIDIWSLLFYQKYPARVCAAMRRSLFRLRVSLP